MQACIEGSSYEPPSRLLGSWNSEPNCSKTVYGLFEGQKDCLLMFYHSVEVLILPTPILCGHALADQKSQIRTPFWKSWIWACVVHHKQFIWVSFLAQMSVIHTSLTYDKPPPFISMCSSVSHWVCCHWGGHSTDKGWHCSCHLWCTSNCGQGTVLINTARNALL